MDEEPQPTATGGGCICVRREGEGVEGLELPEMEGDAVMGEGGVGNGVGGVGSGGGVGGTRLNFNSLMSPEVEEFRDTHLGDDDNDTDEGGILCFDLCVCVCLLFCVWMSFCI